MDNNIRREHLASIYQAAIKAVHPSVVIPAHLSIIGNRLKLGEDIVPLDLFKKIYIAGAGKASGEMALACENILGELIVDGVVAVKNFPSTNLRRIRLISAGHPTPNLNSTLAAADVLAVTEKVDKDDLLIFLLSGGASSLLMDLPDFISLEEMNVFYEDLVNSGADIHEINTVRKHLSRIKGGNLATRCRGKVVNLIISDVPDNDISAIGSGPLTPDNTSFLDAINVIREYNLEHKTPSPIIQHFEKGIQQMLPENPRQTDPAFRRVRSFIVGDLQTAIKAAAAHAEKMGYRPVILDQVMKGNTTIEAKLFMQEMRRINGDNICFITGGETTLKVEGNGKGGRNQHFALSCLADMHTSDVFSVLAAGSDGNDGPTDAAGAFADKVTLEVAQNLSLNTSDYLHHFDAYHFFKQTRSLFSTGPTGTNVMDLVIGIV